MRKQLIAIATAGVLVLPIAGCRVRQTEEGRMPDVDVNVEDTGKLPEYDVDAADVDVTTERRTVEVPTVDVETEEREITVPDIDISEPRDGDQDASEEQRPRPANPPQR